VREPPVLVIGIGNAYGGDDAAGLVAARQLAAAASGRVTVREATGEGAALLNTWANAPAVILIDAIWSGARPGTVRRLDAGTSPLPSKFFRYSTHAFGVADAVELGRALGRLPAQLIVFGIEGRNFGAGVGLSQAVEGGVRRAVRRAQVEIDRMAAAAPKTVVGGSP